MHLFHKWKVKKVEVARYKYAIETLVLYRCAKCPKAKTMSYEGAWGLDDFT